jgi:hypothetical protein
LCSGERVDAFSSSTSAHPATDHTGNVFVGGGRSLLLGSSQEGRIEDNLEAKIVAIRRAGASGSGEGVRRGHD